MVEKDEKSKKKGKKAKVPNPITVGDQFSNFPIKFWSEWKHDCQTNFGDCYWMKMWSDHQLAQRLDDKAQILALTEAQNQQQEESGTDENADESVICLGGNKLE